MSVDRDLWAAAYAAQAQSDWRVYQMLSSTHGLEACHSLHYLQMTCEKIAKAYRLRDTAADEHTATHSHVSFHAFMMSYLNSGFIRQYYRKKPRARTDALSFADQTARSIERLAPAVDPAATPTNAEYPWVEGSTVVVPCRYSFPDMTRLNCPDGRRFLKLLELAIDNFDQIRL